MTASCSTAARSLAAETIAPLVQNWLDRDRRMKPTWSVGRVGVHTRDHGHYRTSLVQGAHGAPTRTGSPKKRRAASRSISASPSWRSPDGLTVEIVDVPGHERFVKNMLAACGGIDLAVLVDRGATRA
jgi:hypothetical protein